MQTEHIGHIYQTTDYDLFSYYEGNRRISEEHVKGLLKSFNECHYEFVPIIVTPGMVVLDGQHRLEASKKGGYPVSFVVTPDNIVPTQTIRQLNQNQKPLTLPEYLHLHVEDGISEYIEFNRLLESYNNKVDKAGLTRNTNDGYKLGFTSMLGLLCGRKNIEVAALIKHTPLPWNVGHPGAKLTDLFKSGNIKMDSVAKGVATLDYLLEVLDVSPRQRAKGKLHRNAYLHLRTRNYLCAFHYLLHYRNTKVSNTNEIFDPDVFLVQVARHPKRLLLDGNGFSADYTGKWHDSVRHIEDIYNFKSELDGYVYLSRGGTQ
tara:strand:- start:2352 stop:3305 length:954 start_codon:yes stop_codon:yes gene_type:complete